jgi:methionyl-tRNA formyltransferase
MRLIFAGTPEFARVALQHLHAAGHDIALVLTQPDRPGGRGLKLQPSAVKQFALEKNLPLCQPRSLRLDGKYPEDAMAARAAIETAKAQVMVVAAYGLILPQWVLSSFKFGCLNIHGSVLPRWRGAAPIHRAVQAGDAQTGVTIMQMDAGLDTGDMLLVEKLPILPNDTTGALHDQLAVLGAQMMVRTLALAEAGALQPVKQAETGVTYAQKIDKREAALDWNQPARQIVRHILAFNPTPGATAALGGETVKLWRASEAAVQPGASSPMRATTTSPHAAKPGDVIGLAPEGLLVQAQDGVVAISELQRAGGKRLPASAFAQGLSSFTTAKKTA